MEGGADTPFAGAATTYTELSEKLGNLSQELASAPVEGSGATISVLTSNMERRAQWAQEMSQDSSNVADACTKQAETDRELAAKLASGDEETLRQDVLDAQRDLASGRGTPEDLQAAVDAYNKGKEARDEARREHADATSSTKLPDSAFPSSSKDVPVKNSDSEMSGSGSSSSGGGSGGGDSSMPGDSSSPSDEPAPGDTQLSSDTAAPASSSPMLGTPQAPAQSPAAAMGAAPQQPQMAPMQPTAATPNTGAVPTTGAKDRLDTGKLARDLASGNRYGMPRLDTSIGTQTSGASGEPDRGSSNSGTTTRADTSGNVKSALSSGTAGAPGSAAQQGAGMMRGGGMGGGMMGGGHGAGGGSGSSKERPQILTADPDLLGTEDESNSVKSGILGRDTASDPNKDR